MKNFAFVLLTMFFVGMTFTSCSDNCQTCTGCTDTALNTEHCEGDGALSGSVFDAEILSYEALGCTCD